MIERSQRDGVTLLRMAHGKANALDLELLEALSRAFEHERRASREPLVLTGSGRIFSAGVDLFRILSGGRAYIERFLPALDEAILSIFDFPRPVVAAINGHAIAGGCVLACACDRRLFVAERATIGVPELRVGVPFPLVALEMVERILPPQRREEVVYLGRTYEPAGALELGLVQELVPAAELEARARAAALELASIPAATFEASKRALHDRSHSRFGGRIELSRERTLELWCADDVQAAIRDYVERTLPRA